MGTFKKTHTDSFVASGAFGGRPTQMTNTKDDIYYQNMHKTMTELAGNGNYNSNDAGSTTQRDALFTAQDDMMNSSMYGSE